MSARQLKTRLKTMLGQDDWRIQLDEMLQGLPPGEARSVVGPLFSLLLLDGVVRWRATTSLGAAVARLCQGGPAEREAARDVLRRLLWNLNEESGNVAWGAPEALAECLVQQEQLAQEFHNILISYIDSTIHHGLWLELPLLRRGAVWGVSRLCCARPALMTRAVRPLLACLDDCEDPQIPGLAVWGLGCLAGHAEMPQEARPALRSLCSSPVPVLWYLDGQLQELPTSQLASQALSRLFPAPPPAA